ncbi:MAG: large conductance mechanosensitive channel protein MscL [Pyrinomonadaceae bacterium]
MLADFKTFIFRGNVIDLAVAVIIGASFTKIVTTLSEGIISPFIGLATGGIDFKDKFYDLSGKCAAIDGKGVEQCVKDGLPLVRYCELINDVINFLIVALVVFLIVRWAGKYLRFMEAAPVPPTTSEVLLAEIRDELKSRPKV